MARPVTPDRTENAPDALVIGAGPAGAAAAITLSRGGARVTLTDHAEFPRPKLCGGCLASAGVHLLSELGIADTLPSLTRAPEYSTLELVTRADRARIPIAPYRVIDRARFDHELVHNAIREGVTFLPSTTARVEPDLSVTLDPREGIESPLHPKITIVADGLKGTSLGDDPRFTWRVDQRAHVGIGTIAAHTPPGIARDAITMHHTDPGYLGLAPLADGRLVIGAAADPKWIQEHARGGPLPALLELCGLDPIELGHPARPIGAPQLTRRRRNVEAGGRLFLIGDATGYLEPFTGEGMTWALEHARHLAPIALRALAAGPQPGAWTRTHARIRRRRTLLCTTTGMLLRRRGLTRFVVGTCARSGLATRFLSAGVEQIRSRPVKDIA